MNKHFFVYALVLPLAVLLGFLLSSPTDFSNFALLAFILFLLSIPLWIREHHMVLIATWNAALVVPFVPGQPGLGIAVAVISLGFSILSRALRKQGPFMLVPQVMIPLVLFTIVVIVTIALTGGIGARVLGTENFGGKRYLSLLGAIMGFFALVALPIPKHRARMMALLFFAAGLTSIIPDLIFVAGPAFYFLFAVFRTDMAMLLATTQDIMHRSTGIAWTASYAYALMLLRYGIMGIFDLARPWRVVIFTGICMMSLLGGFRSTLITMGLIFGIQLFFERVYRTKVLPVLLIVGLLAGGTLIAFVEKMPLAVQRSMSFLPIEVHPLAKSDAANTLDWRLQMWRVVVREIPDHFWLGKGFTFNATDLYLTQEGVRRGYFTAYEDTLVTGNYHNGILTVLIPFGIFGFTTFIWFCIAGLWVMYRNWRNSEPELQHINAFLVSYYLAYLIFYIVFYGQVELDMHLFTGTLGLSISINRGVRGSYEFDKEVLPAEAEPETAPEEEVEPPPPRLQPVFR